MSAEDLRAAILADDDLPREPADVPWHTDEKIYVQAMSLKAWEPWLDPDGNVIMTPKVMAQLAAAALVTEDGGRIFRDSDATALMRKNAQVIMKVATQVMRLSGLDQSAEDVAEHFGEAQPST
jgi:hypothetical protein